ncbi:hypothetical protein GCM10010038_22050 [Glutamicibacter protophormiae]|nr:hypothetical protein GCM10010038_22050 [Glutamicibacter protophormiae]
MDTGLSAALGGARIHQRTVQQLNLVNDKTIIRARFSAGERCPEPDSGPVPQDSLRSPVPNAGTLAMENHDVIPQYSR